MISSRINTNKSDSHARYDSTQSVVHHLAEHDMLRQT